MFALSRRIRHGLLAVVLVGFSPEPLVSPPATPPVPAAPDQVDDAWWQRVSADLARREYEPSPGDEGLQAPNRAHNLRARFGPEGIAVGPRVPGGAAPAWRFAWTTTAIGRPGRMEAAVPAVPHAAGARVTYARPGWTEWYENTPAGLEQGFTIDVRPRGEGPLRITGMLGGGVEGSLVDGAVDLCDQHGARVLRYGKLVVVDARGRPVPSGLALDGRTLAIEVGDRGAAYPITIDPLMTSPAWTAESDQVRANFGCAAATAGDVNGDGFSDVVIGAYQYDNGEDNEGRAFLYLGSPGGLGAAPAWTAEGDQAGGEFGFAVAAAGDVNGDGFGDVIIGARAYTSIEASAGRAVVYHGSPVGLGAAPAWVVDGDQNSGGFGMSVAGAGDINGDGFADIVVGAPWHNSPLSEEGAAYVFMGSAVGLAAAPAWVNEGNQVEAGYGQSVATAGDVNGDGYSDVIIGARGYSNGQTQEGAAFVYHGSAAGLTSVPAWSAESGQEHSLFGWSVATAGDTNGDGFADVIVGSPQFDRDQPGDNAGRAFVFRGSAGGLAATPIWVADCVQHFAWFGISVGTAGDVNGDGFADIAVGASFYDNGEENEGAAFVYYGYAAGIPTSPSWVGETNQVEGGYFDWNFPVGTAGDVNGDGFADVLFGAQFYTNGELDEGRAFLYHGASDGLPPFPSWFTSGGQVGAGWGWSAATAGDVNGDGYSDVIAVATAYDNGQVDEGKAWVYHGSLSGTSSFPAWSAETNQVSAGITAAATAGDVNGDGYSDVILGSSQFDGGQSDEGRTFLYLGSPNGLGAFAVWTSEPDQAGAWFGYAVGSAGDVNGDGYADVIVGAPYYDNGQTSEGRAWLYPGSAGGLGGPAWAIEGDQDGAALGISAGTAGDVNADGFSDVLLGLSQYDRGQSNEGVVWVFHGSENGLGGTPSRIVEADQAEASFGTRAATAGDVNGDGYSDVIVSATRFDGGQEDEGRAYVYHGGAGGLAALPAWTTESDQYLAQLGWSAATAGDVNGDGYSDVIVGAHFYDNGETNEGKVWLYQGSPAGLGAPVWTSEGGQAGAVFGISAATAGDVNGDGFSDVIVGAADYDYGFNGEGAVWIWFGNQGDGLNRIRLQTRVNEIVPIDLLGRSDSESAFRLHALARTPAGRGKVRLEIEAKPLGIPFDGTDLVTGPFVRTNVPAVDGSTVALLETVPGLLPGTVYRWRLRFASDSPYFPHSPWLWLAANAVTEGDVRTGGDPIGIDEELALDPALAAAAPRLERAEPNPFATWTAFTYALPAQGHVRLAVFDVAGRTVAVLAEGARSAGRYSARWDGRDDAGRTLAAGVYFVRLEVDGRVEARKIAISR